MRSAGQNLDMHNHVRMPFHIKNTYRKSALHRKENHVGLN